MLGVMGCAVFFWIVGLDVDLGFDRGDNCVCWVKDWQMLCDAVCILSICLGSFCMLCPFCQLNKDKVIDSRATDGGKVIRRRRECLGCDKRFTTYEYIEQVSRLSVVKKDGSRVPYDRNKVLNGLRKACFKRPVSAERMDEVVDQIEEILFSKHDREVDAVEIGHLLAESLKHVDQVAYVRFASVYKQFRDLDDLLDEVRELLANPDMDLPEQGKLFS